MIGIFDSGIGGLTVAKSLMKMLPDYNIVYFGDTARSPYGTKSPETVISYSLQNTEFLISQGAKIIIIACNTASSVAVNAIIRQFDIPLFEVITPAVNCAVEASKGLRIGIIGTQATIRSNIYEEKILQAHPKATVYSIACPMLVPIVEEGWFNKPETRMILKKYLHPLKMNQIDTLILGCTHYPLLKDIIQIKIGKRVNVIDSAEGVVKEIKRFLNKYPEIESTLEKKGEYKLFVSDITEQFQKIAKVMLKRNFTLRKIDAK